MEIRADALLRVVRACRVSIKLAEALKYVMTDDTDTVADNIAGDLQEALCKIAREKLGPGQDYQADSEVYKLLTSDKSDGAVTLKIAKMCIRNDEQPKPQIMSPDDVRNLHAIAGGYQAPESTPEGEFDDPVMAMRIATRKTLETMQENEMLKRHLKSAGNELCYQCGQYKNEHMGACDGCRWRKVKSGEMPL